MKKRITRREMLKLSGTVAAGSLLAVAAQAAKETVPDVEEAAPAAQAAQGGVYAVVTPLGESTVKMIPMAPRLDTLEGKTICEVWNMGFRGDTTFAFIEELLKKKYPTIKIIPWTAMPNITHESMQPEVRQKSIDDLKAAMKKNGCNAVIGGNGG